MILGFSYTHRNSSVDELEAAAALMPESSDFLAAGVATEAVRIATCNRHEIYLETASEAAAGDFFRVRMSSHADRSRVLRDLDAVEHLFRVAASLDSLVVGENQILGQIHRAERRAIEEKTIGPRLRRLFVEARRAGRAVRRSTGLASGTVSVASIAATLAERIFGSLAGRRALCVGAGEMGEIVLKYLAGAGATLSVQWHRNRERAERLAAAAGASVVAPENRVRAMIEADVVVAATGGTAPAVTATDLREVMPLRNRRPIFLIDLGLPRNIDPACAALDGVYLYNLDDFEAIAEDHRARRRGEIESAARIVGAAVAAWPSIVRNLDLSPEISGAARRLEEIEREASSSLATDREKRVLRRAFGRVFFLARRSLEAGSDLERGLRRAAFRELFRLEANAR